MDIVIKNVTGHPSNDWCILELKKCGFPAGSKVYNVSYQENNGGCFWSNGNDDCVAYIGQTCEVIND